MVPVGLLQPLAHMYRQLHRRCVCSGESWQLVCTDANEGQPPSVQTSPQMPAVGLPSALSQLQQVRPSAQSELEAHSGSHGKGLTIRSNHAPPSQVANAVSTQTSVDSQQYGLYAHIVPLVRWHTAPGDGT